MKQDNFDEDMELKALKAAYRRVFAGDTGKLVLDDILSACLHGNGICLPTKADESIDPLYVAKCAGQQEVGWHISEMLSNDDE